MWSMLSAITAAFSLYGYQRVPSASVGALLIVLFIIALGFYRKPFIRAYVLPLLFFQVWCVGYTWYFTPDFNIPAHNHLCGWVSNLPIQRQFLTQFEFQIDQPKAMRAKVKLSWFKAPKLAVDQYWCFDAKLKAPHGHANPGSFNLELWMVLHGFAATGYVKNKAAVYHPEQQRFRVIPWLRQRIYDDLKKLPQTELMSALILGIHSLPYQQKMQYQRAGISHLMAISGLHIGLIAGLFYFLSFYSMRLLTSRASDIATTVALCAAVVYAMIAGLSSPTQRALMMLVIGSCTRFLRIDITLSQNLRWVLILSILINPWCVFDISFCLSFMAVMIINLCLFKKMPLWQFQFAISLGLLPVTAWNFQLISIVGFLVNLIAIPWMSFVILPLCFLSLIPIPGWHAWCLWLTNLNIILFNDMIDLALTLPWSYLTISLNTLEFTLAQTMVLLILSPKQWPGKNLSLLLALMIYQSFQQQPEIRFTILDVGQGLSVIFQYHGRVLIYDTGPRFGLIDAGSRVIIPYLNYYHINKIDTVVISHGDLDHRGGLRSLYQRFPIKRIISGEPHRLKFPAIPCEQNQSWQWDDIKFKFLHPKNHDDGNNSSCVLQIEFNNTRIILPGDIERQVEEALSQSTKKPALILVAAHHGSKTSSSKSWMKKLNPKYLVFSTGYHNRFHFPHQVITSAYCQQAVCFNTATDGAIQFTFYPFKITRYRQTHQHFWSHACSDMLC